MIKRSDILIAAGKHVLAVLENLHGRNAVLMSEAGTSGIGHDDTRKWFPHEQLDILWVGRFIFTKQLELAIRAVAATRNPRVHLHVCGTGSDEAVAYYKKVADQCGLGDRCHWYGKLSHDVVLDKMGQCDLLFFSSIMDGTPATVLEAITAGLPILSFDAFGYGKMVREFAGVAIDMSTPEQSITDFAEVINRLEADRSLLMRISEQEVEHRASLSWEFKVRQLLELYRQAVVGKASVQGAEQ